MAGMEDGSVIDLSDDEGGNDDSMDANEGLLTSDESNDESIESLNHDQEEVEAVGMEPKEERCVEVKNWREAYDVSDHVTTTVGGVHVTFPFPPYPIQKAYMSKVLACIKNKTNGLLESPTGTGKTLSLLCSSGAWLRTEIEKFDRLEEAYVHGTDSDLENLVAVLDNMADADVNVQFLNEMMAAPSGSNDIKSHSSTNGRQNRGNGSSKSKSGLPKVQVGLPGGNGNDGISSIDSGMSSLNGDTPSDTCDSSKNGQTGQKMKPRRPRVVYASRTHDQLSQSMKELKRSAYRDIPAVILASKDHLCVNPDVTKLGTLNEKNAACRDLRLNKKCPYYQGEKRKMEKVMKMIHHMGKTSGPVMDIEDMITAGKMVKCCPYYAAPEIGVTKASIIFTPYNYLLDSRLRNGSKIPIKESVIIFDEGHNIEGSCEDSASSQIKLTNLTIVRDGITEFITYLNNGIVDTSRESVIADVSIQDITELQQLANDLIRNFKRYISTSSTGQSKVSTGQFREDGSEKVFYPETQWLVDLFNQIGALERGHAIINTLDRIASYVHDTKLPMVVPRVGFVGACDKLQEFIDKMLPPEMKLMESLDEFYAHFNRKYRIALEMDTHPQHGSGGTDTYESDTYEGDPYGSSAYFKKGKGRKGRNQMTDFSLKLLCCSPSVTMNRLISAGTRSIIVTSGTLAPMSSYPHDMEMEFKEILQNSHVIKSDQLMVFPVPGFRATIFDSSYKNRQNLTYYKAIGEALKEYVSRIPGGILLFFPSYTFKMKCQELWNKWNLLDAIQQIKPIFDEPKNRAEFSGILSSFRDAVDSDGSRGAILTGVFRGKLSEGLDLKDKYCRTTIVIGLPYPALKEPKITLKRQYLDREKIKSLSSGTWYELQMLRAVNQAIGRIIRHKNDYGLILLLDHRYNQEKIQNGLSKWLQKYIRSPKEVKGIVFDKFFHENFIREERMAFGIPSTQMTPSAASWDEGSQFIAEGGLQITKRSEDEKEIYTGSTITLSGTSTDSQVVDSGSKKGYSIKVHSKKGDSKKGDSKKGDGTNCVPTVTNGHKNDLFSKPSSLDRKASSSTDNSSLMSDVSFSTGDSSLSVTKVSSGDSSMSFDLNLNEVDAESPVVPKKSQKADAESPIVPKKTQRRPALSKFIYKGEAPLIEIESSQGTQDCDLDVSNGNAHKKLKTETSTPKVSSNHVSSDRIPTVTIPNVKIPNSDIPDVRTSIAASQVMNNWEISSSNRREPTVETLTSETSTNRVSSGIRSLSGPNIEVPNEEIPNGEKNVKEFDEVVDLTDDFLNDSFDEIDTSIITADPSSPPIDTNVIITHPSLPPIVAPSTSVEKSGYDPSSSQGSIEWEEVDNSIFNCIN